jgi:hypothetical protein
MQIAKVTNGVVGQVGEHTALFPNTSFAGDPNPEFLLEHDCLRVFSWLPHDPDTHKLIAVSPYIDSGSVYTVETLELSQAELDARAADALAATKAKRAVAYQQESDPLFFKAQRGEALMDEWLAKVAEIKARY